MDTSTLLTDFTSKDTLTGSMTILQRTLQMIQHSHSTSIRITLMTLQTLRTQAAISTYGRRMFSTFIKPKEFHSIAALEFKTIGQLDL